MNLNNNNHTYCNNCEKPGHSFSNCRKPLVSHGIITYRENSANQYEYLLVCRKHTFGFIDFMRGKYAINNKNHIKDIINEMTNEEKNSIREKPFIDIWLELWGSQSNTYFVNEKIFANEKFNLLAKGIVINDDFYNTKSLLDECSMDWKTPEWGFPKGRKNFKECGKDCALREWSEETGYKNEDVELIDNIATFDEVVIGSNYQSYKDSYYLGKFKGVTNDSNRIKIQKMELSDAKWCTLEEVCKLVRPYHLERLKIIRMVDSLLNKYQHYIYG